MKECNTIIKMMVRALEKIGLEEVFEKDEYESRRKQLPGTRLMIVMVIYQMIKSRYMRGLVNAIAENEELQKVVGNKIALNTLSNALAHRPVAQVIDALELVISHYGEQIEQLGKKFARIGLIDSTLIKLSLAAYQWAEYRDKTGGAKLHMVLDWGKRIPQQLVMTTGKVHDVNPSIKTTWQAGWTYVQDRGYLCFARLSEITNAGADFVIRVKHNTCFEIKESYEVDTRKQNNGITLTADYTIILTGLPSLPLRLVTYLLPDGTLVRVLTTRFDLSALNVAQLYKERWKIENWWKWLKSIFKLKQPISRNQNGFQIQVITALITDLILKVFKQVGHFSASLYEFVVRCQEFSLLPVSSLADGLFRRSLLLIFLFLFPINLLPFARAS